MLHQLDKFTLDNNWLYKHMEELQDKFSERYIAIDSEEVIASDSTIHGLMQKLKEKKKNPELLVIEYIFPKGIVIIV